MHVCHCVGSKFNFLQLLITVPGVMLNALPSVIKYFVVVPQRFYEGRQSAIIYEKGITLF